jgi:hypothetical protein
LEKISPLFKLGVLVPNPLERGRKWLYYQMVRGKIKGGEIVGKRDFRRFKLQINRAI